MAKYTGPACRQCRREGVKLFLKGDRCFSDKCAITRRSTVPGQHGAGRKTVKEYGLQLREKQKAKRYYGILEKQFRNYYDKASRQEGKAGENLLTMIEKRLDNVVYRLGFADSRREARQFVLHGHFTLNGKKVNIPSLIVKPGDVISIKDTSRAKPRIKEILEGVEATNTPKWIELDKTNFVAKIAQNPQRDDIDFPFEENLIVELYSK
ncbi:MAG: 30S ribosomal protein S4 [Ruminococcaceae bacterium]|nr:30S ribosomal protein S4 [Oscillospiraceae bacterium]